MKVRAITGRTATTLEVQGVVDGPIPWPAPFGSGSGRNLPSSGAGGGAPGAQLGGVVVDLGAVPYVTVEGIAAWARSMRQVASAGGPSPLSRDRDRGHGDVFLSRVRPAVLALFGMNTQMTEGLVIVTFYCPYVCSSCKAPFERLADMRVDGPAIQSGAPPFHSCPSCGGAGAFDDNPKLLFAPVMQQSALRLPEGVDALIEGKPDVVASAQLSVELDVEGDVTALWLAGTLQRSRQLIRVAPGLRGPLVIVANEVAGTTGEGLDSLRELLMNVDGEVVLARVSSQLAQGLATTLHGTGRASVYSGRLPYGCDSCNKVVLVDVELDAMAKGTPQKCPACHSNLKPKFGDREMFPLASLPTQRPSEEVRSYLGRHPHPPSVDRSAEWTNALGLQKAQGQPGAGMADSQLGGSTDGHGALNDPTASLPSTAQTTPVQLRHSSDTGMARRPAHGRDRGGTLDDSAMDTGSNSDSSSIDEGIDDSVDSAQGMDDVDDINSVSSANIVGSVTGSASGSSPAAINRGGSRPGRPGPGPGRPGSRAGGQTDDAASTALDRVVPTRPHHKIQGYTSDVSATGGGGRYEIIRRLGAGGMAETLLGRHVGIGGFEKRVVIKRILPNLASQPAFVDMFLHEARVAARINHSNVVQIFDFGRMGEDYYIVMEYVRGWDLSSLIRSSVRLGKPMPIEVACRIASEICAGLTAAHNAVDDTGTSNPIIHRDISPHNILVSLDGAVKLSDFGIAKTAKDLEKMAVTDPGSVKGKVAYLAPEVIQGHPPTTKIDIYAVGLTLYTALVGKNPYQRKGDIQTMYAVAQEPLPNIIKERRDVPFQLASIVGRAVHRDPGQRFPTAQMLQLHLESFLSEIERAQPSTPMHIALWITELARDAQEHHGGLQMDSDSTPSGTPEMIGTLATPGPEPDRTQAHEPLRGTSGASASPSQVAAPDQSEDATLVRLPDAGKR